MKTTLNDQVIELSCPDCGHKFKERIGKLRLSPLLTCGNCGASIKIEADQLNTAISQAEQSLADLQRTLGRLGK